MAVRLDAWIGLRSPVGRVAEAPRKSTVLSFEERVARIQRRRRLSQAQGALEGAIWLAGTAAVLVIAFAGIYGLR